MSTSTISGFGKAAAALAAGLGTAGLIIALFGGGDGIRRQQNVGPALTPVVHRESGGRPAQPGRSELAGLVKVRPAPEFIEKGLIWIVKAQHKDGGWGAGSHAHQDIRDPHNVAVDPATTAFVASALLRYGHTPTAGKYQDNARRATEYLCSAVEEYTKPGPKITDLEGTQIQAKLGPLVDTAMTAQYLARVLAVLPKTDRLHGRVDKALDKCLAKLNESQQKDGSWNVGGGWASVLQSSLGCSALEYAQAAGKPVDQDRLDKARSYQLGNFDAKTGAVKTEAAAGVTLYAYNSSLRANVAQAKAADDYIARAKEEGKLAADAPVNEENLKTAGVKDADAKRLFAANSNVAVQIPTLNGISSLSGGTTVASTSAPPPVAAPATGPLAKPATPPAGTIASLADISRPVSGGAGGSISAAGEIAPVATSRPMPAGGAAVTDDEALLAGFGNNGGEEFLSYMLASESMVILGEKDWNQWYDRMSGRLAKVQNPDGSWSGDHCITSPVFCTAAVVQTMTADHDAEMLTRLSKEASALAKADVNISDEKK